MKKITKSTYQQWYKDMYLWRKFEDKCAALYIQQKIRGFLHLYNGQEAVLAGSLHAMDLEVDKMITAYRNHVQPIGMGVDPRRVLAELCGRATGTSQGLGGSMHIFSKEHNFFGGHGIVGGQIPLGAGIAFADMYHDRKSVTLTYMGDGAIRQGAFHETLNLAMLWKIPVVFIIENNGYAMGTSVERSANHTDLYKLGLGYEMPCKAIDGMHPEEVAKGLKEPIERARKGGGPSLIEIKTYRYRGHSMSDAQTYRTKEEVAEYQQIDPIVQVKDKLLSEKWSTEEDIKQMELEVTELVKECEQFALESPFPERNVMFDVVYEQQDYPFVQS